MVGVAKHHQVHRPQIVHQTAVEFAIVGQAEALNGEGAVVLVDTQAVKRPVPAPFLSSLLLPSSLEDLVNDPIALVEPIGPTKRVHLSAHNVPHSPINRTPPCLGVRLNCRGKDRVARVGGDLPVRLAGHAVDEIGALLPEVVDQHCVPVHQGAAAHKEVVVARLVLQEKLVQALDLPRKIAVVLDPGKAAVQVRSEGHLVSSTQVHERGVEIKVLAGEFVDNKLLLEEARPRAPSIDVVVHLPTLSLALTKAVVADIRRVGLPAQEGVSVHCCFAYSSLGSANRCALIGVVQESIGADLIGQCLQGVLRCGWNSYEQGYQ